MKSPLLALLCTILASCGQGGPDRSSGAWIEDIKLCAESVKRVTQGFDSVQALPTLTIKFRPEAAKRLNAMSETMVGQRINTYLNGRIIASPTLAEPLTGDEIQMLAPPEGAFVDIAAYSEIPC